MPLISDIPGLPPLEQVRIECSIAAGIKYDVPVNIVLAIAEKEGGKPGLWVKNKNGSYDVGVMQFNTNYLLELKKHGISPRDVAAKGCFPFDLAAWRLRLHIKNDQGDLWQRVANYHSKTPKYNFTYRADVITKSRKWAKWLDAHFVTKNKSPRDVISISKTPSKELL